MPTRATKEAVDLATLRRANDALKDSGKLVRRNLGQTMTGGLTPAPTRAAGGALEYYGNGPSASPRLSADTLRESLRLEGLDEEFLDIAMAGSVPAQEQAARLAGPNGRVFARGDLLATLRAHDGNPEIRDGIEALSNEGREAFNRAVLQHEVAEIGRHFGPGRLASHLSTRPMLQDLNIAATLEGPGADAAGALRTMRDQEVAALSTVVPGTERLQLGHQRLSRHAQKRYQEAYERGLRRINDAWHAKHGHVSFATKLAAHVPRALAKRAEDMGKGPAMPDIGKPPSASPVSPPKPKAAFKPVVPKFTPPSLKTLSGATSGSIT